MDNLAIMEYIWHRLPIILIFINSYLVYRLLVSTQLTHVFVQKAINKSNGNIYQIISYILLTGALLSFFIPNAVTVLILLPVIKQIEKQMALSDISKKESFKITTALALSAIYGANIGGMGSLVGSPANLVLIGALDLLGGHKSVNITFLNWFLWSIPLVSLFLTCAYCVIRYFVIPSSNASHICCIDNSNQLNNKQKKALLLFFIFVLFWITNSLFQQLFNSYEKNQSFFCLIFIFFFMIGLFSNPKVLPYKELIRGVPVRGFFVLLIFIAFMIMVRTLKIDQLGAKYLNQILPSKTSTYILVFWITSISIILTEFLSNTVVSTALFPIVYQTAMVNNILPITLMIPVSVASTCAFMTPIATPCNAFVYGEMKGIKLSKMIFCGLLLNLLCVLCVTFWIPIILPIIYGNP